MDREAALWEYIPVPFSQETALAALTESARRWFCEQVGVPTTAQRLAWPALAEGKNLLLCAPTGCGKTLAGFLPLLGELLNGSLVSGVRCLYVAPLKALGNDVAKNLRAAVEGIRSFLPSGWGKIHIGQRTGDTSSILRRRQQWQPPEILLTTPESLAVVLSQTWAEAFFANLRWVVIDEVHALATEKRGCDLSLSLERLTHLVGEEVQRIGLSATCTPPSTAAQFLVGEQRSCTIAVAPDTSSLELTVEPLPDDDRFLSALVTRLGTELTHHRSTLIFTNTRGLAEKLAWALRRRYPAWHDELAVHHSALAAGRRKQVERALKQGRLRAVVSSTSLELGIDIGSVESVVLVHPPGDVVRLLQRVGRSGHGPGLTRRGLVLTSHTSELLEAAVTSASCHSAQIEPLCIPEHPLDVLCQQLLGMATHRSWDWDEAYALIGRALPYRHLSREDYEDCLHYLLGQHRDGRAWLPPRLTQKDDRFRIVDGRTERIVRRNLGTILAEQPRTVKLSEGAVIGEVEETFAERLNPGDRFLLDGRCLEYRREEGNHLLVDEVPGRPVIPRWSAEGWPLSPPLARRIYIERARMAEALRGGSSALDDLLDKEYGLGDPARHAISEFLERQEAVSEVPAVSALFVETVPRQGAVDYYFHTPLNRASNDAVARLLVFRLARQDGRTAYSLITEMGFSLGIAGGEILAEHWRRLLNADRFEEDLTEALQDSSILRQRFQRVAQTGLMLLRNPLGRQPRVGGRSWGERRLFDQVRAGDPHFVLLRQAEREVREKVLDAVGAHQFLIEMPRRDLRCRRLAQLSPFVEQWAMMTPGPTESTESASEVLQRLHASLMGSSE